MIENGPGAPPAWSMRKPLNTCGAGFAMLMFAVAPSTESSEQFFAVQAAFSRISAAAGTTLDSSTTSAGAFPAPEMAGTAGAAGGGTKVAGGSVLLQAPRNSAAKTMLA